MQEAAPIRPFHLRRPEFDRGLLALWAGAALVGVALVTLIVVTSRGGEEPPPEDVAASPTATSTPAFVLPPLPGGCMFLKTVQPGPGPMVRSGEPLSVTIEAQDCVAAAWSGIPTDRLGAELAIELLEPDAPAEMLVPLSPVLDGGGLRWSGTVTLPLGGSWRGQLRVAGQGVETFPLFWQAAGPLGLVARPGLPLPAVEHELTVLNIDRPGEPVRWRALESGGMAWIPGAKPGEAARVVWVQARGGREWVVAGDPTTGVVTPLFEVELPALLDGAPDGRAFVVTDRIYGAPQRIRLYDAERSKLVDVAESLLTTGPVSWAPDSSAVFIGGERALLLGSDGSRRPLDNLWRFASGVGWSPDSQWLLAVPEGGSGPRLLRIEVGTGRVIDLLNEVDASEVRVLPQPVFSPDGRRIAVAWVDPPEGTGGVAVFARDEPPPLRIEERSVASYRVPSGFSKVPWLTGFSWSADGAELIVDVLAGEGGGASYEASRLEVIDVASKAVRLVVNPRQGHYGYGAMWVSTDGRALFKQWSSCVACDGGRSGIDVIDLADGAIVRTVEDSVRLGTIDGVRYLLSSPDGLVTVRGLEAPRVLMPGTWGGSTAFAVAASPDGNRVAVRQSSGRTSPVIAVAPDGSAQTVLGYVRPEARIAGLRDASTALVLDYQAGWAWSSLANGALTPLPQQGEGRPETALETAVAISPDRSVAGYWVPGATRPEVALQLLDLRPGTVTSSVATSQQTKGMYLAMSPDGKRVLFPDGDALVAVDVPSRSTVRIPLQRLGYPAGIGTVSSATHGPGGTFEVVAGEKLWRIDPTSGGVQVVTDRQPSPGGWRSAVELSRSPDGQRLVALTQFGLFELQPDGSWRLASGAGLGSMGPGPVTIVWSPDSRRVAYLGSDGAPGGLGIVVVGLDGSGAYELVKQAVGRQMRVLDWLPDGRIVYAVITSGI